MTDIDPTAWDPARRLGLGIFQMIVDQHPVLIYAGRTERDAERYRRMEGSRVVYRYRDNILFAEVGDMHVTGATDEQASFWKTSFLAAVARGDAEQTDPAAYAVKPKMAADGPHEERALMNSESADKLTQEIRDLERVASLLPDLTAAMVQAGRHLAEHGKLTAPSLAEARSAADVLRRLAAALRQNMTDRQRDDLDMPF